MANIHSLVWLFCVYYLSEGLADFQMWQFVAHRKGKALLGVLKLASFSVCVCTYTCMCPLALSGLWLYLKGHSRQVVLQHLFSVDGVLLIAFTIPLIRIDIVVLTQK